MNKKKIFTLLGLTLLLAVLLVGNVSSVFSTEKAKHLEVEDTIKASAIKTFDIDTNKVKPHFSSELNQESTSLTKDIRSKAIRAFRKLTDEGSFKIGDYIPIYFVGENEVSIAIKHPDGTISLDKFDISKEKPIKIDHKVKEAK